MLDKLIVRQREDIRSVMDITEQRIARLSIRTLRQLDVKIRLSRVFLLEAVDHLLQNIENWPPLPIRSM